MASDPSGEPASDPSDEEFLVRLERGIPDLAIGFDRYAAAVVATRSYRHPASAQRRQPEGLVDKIVPRSTGDTAQALNPCFQHRYDGTGAATGQIGARE